MLRRPSPDKEIRHQLGRRFMEEGLALWRCRQQELLYKKSAEQAQLRDMLTAYSPWGRPGGGAPVPDRIRKVHSLKLEALHGRNISSSPLPGGLPKSSSSTSSTGSWRHAPRRRTDPLMWFQPTEPAPPAVLNELRYFRPEHEREAYKRQLDAIVQEKEKARDDETRKEATFEQQLRRLPLPWGRPGPGGTVWRNPRLYNNGSRFNHSMGWSDENTMRNLIKDSETKSTSPTFSFTESPRNEQNAKEIGDDGQESPTSPTERPKSFNSGKSSGSRQKQLSQGGDGVELVPLLAKRRIPPRYFLGTTDVTKPVERQDGREVPIEAHRDYWKELAQQIDRKRVKLAVAQAEDIEASKRHFDTWQVLWGRPGHGAPRPIKVKEKLDVLLYQLPALQIAAR